MTVKELIKFLIEYPNDAIVTVVRTNYARGSSWTGMYECGEHCVAVKEVKYREADTLAGLDEIDRQNHVEFILEDDDY